MRIIILLTITFLSIHTYAQLTHGGNPIIDLSNENNQLEIPTFKIKDFTKDEVYEITSKDSIDYIMGQSIEVNVDIFKKEIAIKTDNNISYLLNCQQIKLMLST